MEFNVNDPIIGHAYPDDCPARITDIDSNKELEYPILYIYFYDCGVKKYATVPSYRVKKLK